MKQHSILAALIAIAFLVAPNAVAQVLPDTIDISVSPDGIVPIPSLVTPTIRNLFDRYTKITAPNGKAIHFIMQNNVTNEQAVRAREVLRFFITDTSGSLYGSNKNAIANSMSNLDATLAFFNSESAANSAFNGPFGNLNLFIQDLYATEAVVEGSNDYFTNNERDATLEEVFHLVHGAGIQPALPVYHSMIWAATTAAMAAGKWTPPPGLPSQDRPFEYIISVIDVYYGFWAHDPDGDGTSFGGEYAYNTRAALVAGDPQGVAAMLAFLPDAFAANLSIASAFSGLFPMNYSPSIEYTHKSRYLQHVNLTGSNSASVQGNSLDNRMSGNSGNNTLSGQSGFDTAIFRGNASDYSVVYSATGLTVTDSNAGRDGVDTLDGVEAMEFADTTIPVHYGASSPSAAVSLTSGGTQVLDLDAGNAFASGNYVVAGTTSGTHPGVGLLGLHIPLNIDWYTSFSLQSVGLSYFASFTGTLDNQGAAQAALTIPPGLSPSLNGLRLHHAFAAHSSNGAPFVSNPISLVLVP